MLRGRANKQEHNKQYDGQLSNHSGIEIPRVLSDFICGQKLLGESVPQPHADWQSIMLRQECGHWILACKW